MGALGEAFKPNALDGPVTSLSQLDPARFLSTPGLWLGLIAAAAFLAAAIHLRRSREPI
jgi:ABC-2 type transport system permease protein